MLKIKTGQASNLPWWRIQNMSDEEIEKYNDSFMMIERLPKSVGIERALQPNVYEKEIWNAAIEAAAKNSAQIRELKDWIRENEI